MVGAIIFLGVFASVAFCIWIFFRGSRSFLTKAVTTLPASAFPARADVYICDKCEHDVTRNFYRGRAHVWSPMGPMRFTCRCGQTYLTGATEWDHLGARERRRRIRDTLLFGLLFSVVATILGLLVYFPLRFAFHLGETGFVVTVVIAALPFAIMQLTFWPGVAASIWRTRFRTIH